MKPPARRARIGLIFLVPLALLVAIYLILATRQLVFPGLNYDEALFINAARGGIDVIFIEYRLGSFPVMLMPYIGALKAWLMAPALALWGVTLASIRLPGIVLSAVSLLVQFAWVRRLTKRPWLALWITAMTALDPTFLGLTRMDVGPFVLEFFLRGLMLWSLARWVDQRDRQSVWLFGIMATLGVFNKLNFIWSVAAALAGLVLAFPREARRLLREMDWWWIGAFAAPFGLFAFLLLAFRGFRLAGVASNADRLAEFLAGFQYLMRGDIFLGTVFPSFDGLNWLPLLWAAGLGVWVISWIRSSLPGARERFLLAYAVAAAAAMTVTGQATGPWHFAALLPFPWLLYGLGALSFTKVRLGRLAAVVLLAVPVAAYGYLSFRAASHWDAPASIPWTPAIYELAEVTRDYPGQVLLTDWGAKTQLLSFDYRADKYLDAWAPLMSGRTDEEFAQTFVNTYVHPPALVIVMAEDREIMYGNRESFFRLAEQQGLELELYRKVPENAPIYEVYELKPSL